VLKCKTIDKIKNIKGGFVCNLLFPISVQFTNKGELKMKNVTAFLALMFTVTLVAGHPAFAADGAGMFKDKCSKCHATTSKKKVGPGLADLNKRPGISKEWAKKWLADPQKVWEENQGYTVTLKKSVKKENKKKTSMKLTGKSAVKADEIDPLVEYIWSL